MVASKPFGESYLLAEMFAQLLEARGIPAARRLGLGATEIAFGALRKSAIDVYPEYTGTGLLAILHERPVPDPREVYARVARECRERFGVRWLPPLGFQNTYAIAVRRETAQRFHLRTLSDLARVGATLRAGLTPDFIGRDDGLPGLGRAYGLRFREVRALLPAVKYQALAAGDVDVIDGYGDGRPDREVRPDRARRRSRILSAVRGRGGDGAGPRRRRSGGRGGPHRAERAARREPAMRALNRRVEVDGEPIARVAADALAELGSRSSVVARPRRGGRGRQPAGKGRARRLSLGRAAHVAGPTQRHLLLVAVSLLAAIALAVPLGLVLERARAGAEAVIRAVGLLQTIPGIALIAFMIPLLGIGVVPALVALFLYSLYPILRNTYTGVRDAAPEAVGAALALGMTPRQILRYVRLPLAAPLIMAGIRTAAVINVGTATLAAFIGAGGLGDPIASGLALSDTRMILSGALPAAALALVVDAALGACERVVRPGGR